MASLGTERRRVAFPLRSRQRACLRGLPAIKLWRRGCRTPRGTRHALIGLMHMGQSTNLDGCGGRSCRRRPTLETLFVRRPAERVGERRLPCRVRTSLTLRIDVPMTLADFIEQQVDALVSDWEGFARSSIPPARNLKPEELRDHAKVLLLAAVEDMKSEQDLAEQHAKSRGDLPNNSPRVTEAAQAHAHHRFVQNFTLNQMVSEYRALRACVIRRWTETGGLDASGAAAEIVRFGETMDQGLTESIAWYSAKVDESRGLLLGVLGHDMRSPLGAVLMSAQYLLQSTAVDGAHLKAVARIMRSGATLRKMVDDLLAFTQTALGLALPISPVRTDVSEICRDVVEELTALHPGREVTFECKGDTAGSFDPARVAQMASNLVSNAIQHGDDDRPVSVDVIGEADAIELRVHNTGPAIPPDVRGTLFEPLRQVASAVEDPHSGSSGLGLGLYIAREIALAHGGSIKVVSSETDGTTFIASVPRQNRI